MVRLIKSGLTITILKWLSDPSGTLCRKLSLIILREDKFIDVLRILTI
jgi:hypothetical protein